jgi:hypothetical protein
MKVVGVILLCIALILAVIAATMSVSVGSFGGRDIANLDLLNTRSNLVMLAGFLFVAAILCFVFGGRPVENQGIKDHENPEKHNFSNEEKERNLVRFEGQRSLDSALYKEFLVSKFHIRRSDALNEFVVGDTSFSNLLDALKFADKSYDSFLEQIEADRLNAIKMDISPKNCPHCLAEFLPNKYLSRYHCSQCALDHRDSPKATSP